MTRIRLAPAARRDLDEIWLYVARESGSEDAATRVVERIIEKFAMFARFPFIGRSIAADRHPDVRTFPADRYVIFYRPAGGEIRILRILHASLGAVTEFLGE
ncbi:MAG TPA: type II toxin-antitoxin system RelE/ParE family toxin [Terracidiphilus sp.]|jgi:plasmid stabilization system protein ParE|nr:type II toxin-antitoxin system RelE/ParE family toxin [Terracidiphilus sp.]